jgi:hypothetical protein
MFNIGGDENGIIGCGVQVNMKQGTGDLERHLQHKPVECFIHRLGPVTSASNSVGTNPGD